MTTTELLAIERRELERASDEIDKLRIARVIALLEFVLAWDALQAHLSADGSAEFWVWMMRDDELQAALHAKRRALDEA
jgi:hypothetical protein